jgi:hypothetical protein
VSPILVGLAIVFGLFLMPAFCAMVGWACLAKSGWPVRHMISVVLGFLFSPANWFALLIYAQNGGGDDPDPFTFLMVVFGLSCLIVSATVLFFDRRELKA